MTSKLKSPTAISLDDLDKLMASTNDKRLKLMMTLAIHHAMRATEVCNLERTPNVSDPAHSYLDLDNKTITVVRLKGSETSVNDLDDDEIAAIKDYLTTVRESRYVFVSQRKGDNPLDRHTFFKGFQECASRAGLPKAKRHPHALKHGTGKIAAESGVNQAEGRAIMGHKSISSFGVYFRVSNEHANKVRQGLFKR